MASHKSLLKTIQTEIILLQNVVLVTLGDTMTPTLSSWGWRVSGCSI